MSGTEPHPGGGDEDDGYDVAREAHVPDRRGDRCGDDRAERRAEAIDAHVLCTARRASGEQWPETTQQIRSPRPSTRAPGSPITRYAALYEVTSAAAIPNAIRPMPNASERQRRDMRITTPSARGRAARWIPVARTTAEAAQSRSFRRWRSMATSNIATAGASMPQLPNHDGRCDEQRHCLCDKRRLAVLAGDQPDEKNHREGGDGIDHCEARIAAERPDQRAQWRWEERDPRRVVRRVGLERDSRDVRPQPAARIAHGQLRSSANEIRSSVGTTRGRDAPPSPSAESIGLALTGRRRRRR